VSTELEARAPFICPDVRVVAEPKAGDQVLPLESLLSSCRSLLGIITEIDVNAVVWLRELLLANTSLRAKLVIVLYPACVTRA